MLLLSVAVSDVASALAKGAVPVFPVVGLVICCAWMALGWILFLGLRILKPQEALVLTLFGKYIGTLKEPGFYFVNPFCVSVNPASKTKLSQSGGCRYQCTEKSFSFHITSKWKQFF